MAGSIRWVVARDVRRLTRDVAAAVMLFRDFEASGTSFISMADFATAGDSSDKHAPMRFSLSLREYESTGCLSLAGQVMRAHAGLWHGGIPPVGNTFRDGTFKYDPKSAKVIQSIFSLFLRLGTAADVVRYLKAQGIHVVSAVHGQTGGHVITADLIHRLLRNPVYAG
jgi:DNA invertase Pin-like site-specific DNA recombinase